MLEQALRYQTQGDGWVRRSLIGGGVVLLSVFVVPILLLYGYLLEVGRRVLRGETTTPPAWSDLDLVETGIDGFKLFVVMAVYGIGVGVVTAIPSTLFSFVGSTVGIGLISLLGTLLGVVLSLVGTLVLAAVVPVASVNYAVEDDIAAGFDREVLRTIGTNTAMLKAVGIGIVINVLVGTVSTVLAVTVIGALAVPSVVFAGLSASYVVWAQGFADAYREEYGDLPEIPDPVTKPDVTPPTGTDEPSPATETDSRAVAEKAKTAATPAELAQTRPDSEPDS